VSDPTVITYQGGSAGDMFAAGLNGFEIEFLDSAYVKRPPWSLKYREKQIIGGQADLATILNEPNFDYLTTHLFEPLVYLRVSVISIVLRDPRSIELTILRQMKLQNLTIEVNPKETAYRLIKKAVDRQHWERAAQCWFVMSRNRWHQDHQHRIHNPLQGSFILNFDRLYHDDFVDSLRSQGFMINLDLIAHNHRSWLQKNLDHDYNSTISSMVQKLQNIDWTQNQESIIYDKS